MLASVSTPEGPKAVFSVTEQDKEKEEYRILGVRMSLYNGSNLTLWKLTRFESGQLSRKWKPILSFQDIQATCLLIENDDDWDDCFRQNG